MNVKFVIRGSILALLAALLITALGLVVIVARTPIGQPPGPTPPPPTILAPRGELPAGPGGLEELAQYRGEPYGLVGSGFFLQLSGGEVVGVMAAHSVPSLGDPNRPLERIGLRVAGQADCVAEFDMLYGPPGRPRDGDDLTVDYVLLHTDQPVDSALVLAPDPRGAPQPGERVALFSGQGDGQGGRRILEGTVQTVSDTAVWVLMDEWFQPGMMSGSPFVSQHTGQAVGMVIAVAPRRNHLLMGMHPIGSIVRWAESATELIQMDDYRQ